MDSIKKKMEKLSTETQMAEQRISQYEEIKLKNELEAEKFEEQLRYSFFLWEILTDYNFWVPYKMANPRKNRHCMRSISIIESKTVSTSTAIHRGVVKPW